MIHFFNSRRSLPIALLAPVLLTAAARASVLDDIGISELRSIRPDLTGTGIAGAQIEATTYNDPTNSGTYNPQYDANNFEVDPSSAGANTSIPITYIGKQGTTPTTTYSSGFGSAHATEVASHFYGLTTGVAPALTAVENYNANYFLSSAILGNATLPAPLAPANAPSVKVINQSFVIDGLDNAHAEAYNQLYDDYVDRYKVTIVTAAGNGNGIQVPGSAYNVITVGDSDGGSSVGPTYLGTDKPDLVAPGGATSFSTPYVSGAAAVLMQAAASNFQSNSTTVSQAQDPRVVKALLLAGTSKPTGWRHYTGNIPNTTIPRTVSNTPLDPTFGAGEVNAYASYQILAAGQKAPSKQDNSAAAVTSPAVGSAGWDWNRLGSSSTTAGYSHYVLNITHPSVLTAALTWDRPAGSVSGGSYAPTSIDNFDLALLDAAGATVGSSASIGYNAVTGVTGPAGSVEYLYTQVLQAGTYDLQVIKNAGGNTSSNYVYALAYNAMLLGDANLDGTVDNTDLQIVLNNFGKPTSLWTNGNFTGDPTIDLSDVSYVLNNMNQSAATTLAAGAPISAALFAAPAAVPEPASLTLLALTLPLLTRRKPRPT